MNLSIRILGLALLLGGALSCGDDHDDDDGHGDEEHENLQKCCYIGEICHEGSEGNEAFSECHNIGHENDAATCGAEFERCKTLCDPEGKTSLPDHCEDPSGDPH
jgi:hypothetical protein